MALIGPVSRVRQKVPRNLIPIPTRTLPFAPCPHASQRLLPSFGAFVHCQMRVFVVASVEIFSLKSESAGMLGAHSFRLLWAWWLWNCPRKNVPLALEVFEKSRGWWSYCWWQWHNWFRTIHSCFANMSFFMGFQLVSAVESQEAIDANIRTAVLLLKFKSFSRRWWICAGILLEWNGADNFRSIFIITRNFHQLHHVIHSNLLGFFGLQIFSELWRQNNKTFSV